MQNADKEEVRTTKLCSTDWEYNFWYENPDNEAEVILIDYLRPPSQPHSRREDRARGEEQSKTNGSRARQQQKWECILGPHPFFSFSADSHCAYSTARATCLVETSGLIGWMDGNFWPGHCPRVIRLIWGTCHEIITLWNLVIKTCFVSFDFYKKKKIKLLYFAIFMKNKQIR